MAINPIKLFCLSALLCFGANVSADQRELKTEDNSKIDAVLLLDASGSMLRTDPTRLRDEGAKLFVQFLKPGDRIAVIQFDATASLIRPFSEFKAEDAAAIGADIAKVGTSGTYTDLLTGVKEAAALLNKEKRPEATGMIVLLSDGKMEPDPSVGAAYGRTEELLNQVLPEIKSKGERIYTLSFSEQADKALLSEIALATDGVGWFATDSGKIHESFADLFLAVKKPQVVPLTGKGFTIDSDIQEATFYVNREEAAELTLLDPDGKKYLPGHEADGIKWFRGQKFDVITIKEPAPGDWRVTGLTSNDGFATVLTNLKLVSDWPTSLVADEPTLLQARLNEGDKPVVLPEMSGATRYALQIVPTDKVAEPVIEDVLFDDGTHGDKIAGDGIFSYKVSLADPGEYKLWIVAKGPTFDRRQQIPFRVKPPLLSISVVKAEEHDSHGPADSHGTASEKHGDEKHGESGHDAVGSGKGEHGEGDKHGDDAHDTPPAHVAGEDIIQIKLSPEVTIMKNVVVKLSAVDEKRRRLNLTPEKGFEEGVYEFPTSKLPEGNYELKATLTAESKKRGSLKEESRPLRYKKVKTEADPIVEVVVEEKPVIAEEPSSVPFILLVIVINGMAGLVTVMLLKKAQGVASFTLPAFASPELALAGIAELEKRNGLNSLSFDDPILSNEVILPAPSAAVAASAPEAPAATGEAAPQEVAPAVEEPPTEDAPSESEEEQK